MYKRVLKIRDDRRCSFRDIAKRLEGEGLKIDPRPGRGLKLICYFEVSYHELLGSIIKYVAKNERSND